MKILHLGKFYPPQRGGIETAVCHLAEAGLVLGHLVRCVVCHPDSKKTTKETRNAVLIERLGTWGSVLSTPLTLGFFLRSFRNIDVVHVHLPNPLAELRILFYLLLHWRSSSRAKVVPFVHALPVSQGFLGRIWFLHITSVLLSLSDRVLVSHTFQLKAFPKLELWKQKIHVIPYTTVCSITDVTDEALARRRNSTRLVAIGRLVRYKGFDVLLEAWKKIQQKDDKNKRFQLQIIGDGPEYPKLKNFIRVHHLSDTVQLLGNVSDEEKFQLLSGALMLVAPSVTCAETFGISILEAMSKGLPVITTRLPTGVSGLARNGECGAVVTPGSVDELANAMTTLLQAPEALTRIGYRNFLYANAHHSHQVLLSNYQGLLESLVKAHKPLTNDFSSNVREPHHDSDVRTGG